MELFAIVIFLTATGAEVSQLEGPQNTLNVVGSTVTLKCSSPSRNCIGIDWMKHLPGASPMTVFKGPRTILSHVDRDRYSVDNSSGCDLVIKNINLTDAGRYICSAIISSSQTTATAYLIVLETQPNCTINAFMDDTVEGDEVQLNFMVAYNATKEEASIVWKSGTDSQAAVENGTQRSCTIIARQTETTKIPEAPTTVAYNGTTNNSNPEVTNKETNRTPIPLKTIICQSCIVVAPAPEVPSFTFIVSFPVETVDIIGVPIAGLATNTLNATCKTPVVKVIYSVRNVALSPSLSRYSLGSVINCTANGHPSPTFKWQEMENGGTWTDTKNGSELTMTDLSSKRYRCFAINVVRVRSFNATSDEIQFNNTNNESTPEGIIYLLIMAAASGVLLLIILLTICFCNKACPGYKCCNSKNKSKDELRDEQPLTENPDVCIYSVVNKGQNIHPKAKSPKRPKGAPPQPKASNADAYQHEEVTYADLALEYGPRKTAPQNHGQATQEETLYAAVGFA